MKWMTVMVALVTGFSLWTVSTGCSDGGCTYHDYAGTCTAVEGRVFTYEGTIDGVAVTAAGNTLPEGMFNPVGSSWDCSLRVSKAGTCTPCLFDVGEPGEEAVKLCNELILQ